MPFFNSVGDAITDAVDNVGDAVSDVVDDVGDTAGEAVAGIAGAIRRVIGAATDEQVDARSGGGLLEIDPDQVDAALKIFQDALNKLRDRVQFATEEIRAQPCAQDQVSGDAALAFNNAATGFGGGAAIYVWRGAVAELESVIEQLKRSKETNMRTDDAVSQPFAAGLQG